ncbi:PREDICTED: uncharacterized protein LOC105458966 [Wasmannia auropunctata]|uniref:uncharacterized protein LOC105458966 n=1 Tax=Wasmannia auropunctata TaxID=64793 RepID=UPI0005EEBAC3|nr:PREDICTED: uncharacterized protein LOC105458966 [Wasmannia auropunctata]
MDRATTWKIFLYHFGQVTVTIRNFKTISCNCNDKYGPVFIRGQYEYHVASTIIQNVVSTASFAHNGLNNFLDYANAAVLSFKSYKNSVKLMVDKGLNLMQQLHAMLSSPSSPLSSDDKNKKQPSGRTRKQRRYRRKLHLKRKKKNNRDKQNRKESTGEHVKKN